MFDLTHDERNKHAIMYNVSALLYHEVNDVANCSAHVTNRSYIDNF